MRHLIPLLLLSSSLPAADLTVGAAQTDITPPKGMPMAGYYSARGAEGTHDKLYARAVVGREFCPPAVCLSDRLH